MCRLATSPAAGDERPRPLRRDGSSSAATAALGGRSSLARRRPRRRLRTRPGRSPATVEGAVALAASLRQPRLRQARPRWLHRQPTRNGPGPGRTRQSSWPGPENDSESRSGGRVTYRAHAVNKTWLPCRDLTFPSAQGMWTKENAGQSLPRCAQDGRARRTRFAGCGLELLLFFVQNEATMVTAQPPPPNKKRIFPVCPAPLCKPVVARTLRLGVAARSH